MRLLLIVLLLLVWALASAPVAYAYIDPTAGGALIQLLLVGGAGVLIFARQLWRRIRARGMGRERGSDRKPDVALSDHENGGEGLR